MYNRTDYTYDDAGNLTHELSSAGEITYSYNAKGRLGQCRLCGGYHQRVGHK
ncbi:MAG: hypothetical protein LBH17_08335 [Oscillospiraceae bacterium]|nr:hypothetical protein [Oscillospiraceae bacterium]